MYLETLLKRATSDARLSTTHIAIYCALLSAWSNNKSGNSVKVARREVMSLAKVRSVTTFHKCIKELVETRYIEYAPSFHPAAETLVSFIYPPHCP